MKLAGDAIWCYNIKNIQGSHKVRLDMYNRKVSVDENLTAKAGLAQPNSRF